MNFVPGEPNRAPQACAFANWSSILILAYCSGNNLVILTKNFGHLQTIYLPGDAYVVDINRVNGKIALVTANTIQIYTPTISNFYNFNFNGRKDPTELDVEWHLETELAVSGGATVTCISWSASCDAREDELDASQFLGLPSEYNSETSCELAVGTDNLLSLWRFFYKNIDNSRKLRHRELWRKTQPNPLYSVQFSPDATAIATIGFGDQLVKVWRRVTFGIEMAEFELSYVRHSSVVTSIRWRQHASSSETATNRVSGTATPSSLKPSNSIIKSDLETHTHASREHNILYSLCEDAILRVFSMCNVNRSFGVAHKGSVNVGLAGSDVLVSIIDSPLVELAASSLLRELRDESMDEYACDSRDNESVTSVETRKQDQLIRVLESQPELCLAIDGSGMVALYALLDVCKMASDRLTAVRLDSGRAVRLGSNCLPKDSRSVFLQEIQAANGSFQMIVHDLVRNSIRHVGVTYKEVLSSPSTPTPLEGLGLPVETGRRDSFRRGSEPSTGVSDLEKEASTSMEKLKPILPYTSGSDLVIGQLEHKFTGHNKSIQRLIRSADGSVFLSVTRFSENCLWTAIPLQNGHQTLNKKSTILTPSPIIDAVFLRRGDFVIVFVDGRLVCYDCRVESQYNGRLTKMAPVLGELVVTKAGELVSFFVVPESKNDDLRDIAENGSPITVNEHIVAVYRDCSCLCWEVTVDSSCSLQITPVELAPLPVKSTIYRASAIGRPSRDALCVVDESGYLEVFQLRLSTNGDLRWQQSAALATGITRPAKINGSATHRIAVVDEPASRLAIWDSRLAMLEYDEYFAAAAIKDVDWTATQYGHAILAVGFSTYSLLYTQLRQDYTNATPTFAVIKKVDIAGNTTHEIGDSIWMADGLLVVGSGNQFYISDKTLDPAHDLLTSKALGTFDIVTNDIFHLCAALNGPLPVYHPQLLIQILYTGRFRLVERILARLGKRLREFDLEGGVMDAELGMESELSEPGDATEHGKNDESTPFSMIAGILLEKLEKLKLPYLSGHQQITLYSTVQIVLDIANKHCHVLDPNGLRFFLGLKLFQLNMTKGSATAISMRDAAFALHSENRDLLYGIVNEQCGFRVCAADALRYRLAWWLDHGKLLEAMETVARNEFLRVQDEQRGLKDPSKCAIYYLALRRKHVLNGLWRTAVGHPEQQKMLRFLGNDFREERWRSAAMKNAFVLLGKHRYSDAAYFFLLADSLKDCVTVLVGKLKDTSLAVAVARCHEGEDGPVLRHLIVSHILPHALESGNRWEISWSCWMLGSKREALEVLIQPMAELCRSVEKAIGVEVKSVGGETEDPVLLVLYDSLRHRHAELLQGEAGGAVAGNEFDFVMAGATMYEKMGCDYLTLYLLKNWAFWGVEEVERVEMKEEVVKEFVAPPASQFAEPDMSAFGF